MHSSKAATLRHCIASCLRSTAAGARDGAAADSRYTSIAYARVFASIRREHPGGWEANRVDSTHGMHRPSLPPDKGALGLECGGIKDTMRSITDSPTCIPTEATGHSDWLVEPDICGARNR